MTFPLHLLMVIRVAAIPNAQLFWAWIALCLALALHVVDEASTGFLSVYNPTVVALRKSRPWLPFPVFTFGVWLAGLVRWETPRLCRGGSKSLTAPAVRGTQIYSDAGRRMRGGGKHV
ncbi:MAG: hypothetical protein ACLQVL_33560, partial [Terriglobia bacterium]